MDAVGELLLGWSACTLEMGMWSLFHQLIMLSLQTYAYFLVIYMRPGRAGSKIGNRSGLEEVATRQ